MKAENRRNETNAADPMFVGTVAIIDAETLARNWWVVLVRGIAGIIFGLITFFAPVISLAALVLLFGAYALADGILAIVSAIRTRSENQHWWVLIIEGIVGVAAGILTMIWPGITALALLFVIAAWALVTGGLEIAAAIRLRKVITHEWLLVLAGIASIALGIILALFPGPGALALVIWIGAYALVSGAMMIGLAFRLRSWARSESPHRLAHGVA
jgi:uncharacterized membrane protein HdeD (DUF308 family)